MDRWYGSKLIWIHFVVSYREWDSALPSTFFTRASSRACPGGTLGASTSPPRCGRCHRFIIGNGTWLWLYAARCGAGVSRALSLAFANKCAAVQQERSWCIRHGCVCYSTADNLWVVLDSPALRQSQT